MEKYFQHSNQEYISPAHRSSQWFQCGVARAFGRLSMATSRVLREEQCDLCMQPSCDKPATYLSTKRHGQEPNPCDKGTHPLWWSLTRLKNCKTMKSSYAWVIFQACSHVRPSSSTRMRSNSGTHSVGWVSFIWMATFEGKLSQLTSPPDLSLKRAMISWIEAEQSVYCCFSLSNFPSSVASPGYNT